jgi:hypothetical protein
MTAARPGIYQLGAVIDDGETVTVSGWGLTWCASRCDCHVPLRIDPGHDGTLGLHSNRACDCCTAWTVDELAAVLRDVVDVGALEATG